MEKYNPAISTYCYYCGNPHADFIQFYNESDDCRTLESIGVCLNCERIIQYMEQNHFEPDNLGDCGYYGILALERLINAFNTQINWYKEILNSNQDKKIMEKYKQILNKLEEASNILTEEEKQYCKAFYEK